jgi:hypothetical protein
MENLALEIGIINRVEINDADLADARRGEVHGNGRAQPACANAQDAGGFDPFLAGQTHFGQNQVPGVPADFLIIQFHNLRKTK